MRYEYGWKDPQSGRVWLDGWQPLGDLIRVRRPVAHWEEFGNDNADD